MWGKRSSRLITKETERRLRAMASIPVQPDETVLLCMAGELPYKAKALMEQMYFHFQEAHKNSFVGCLYLNISDLLALERILKQVSAS